MTHSALKVGELVKIAVIPIGAGEMAVWLGCVVATDAAGIRVTVTGCITTQGTEHDADWAGGGERFIPWQRVMSVGIGGEDA
jgi:hypothetical protein